MTQPILHKHLIYLMPEPKIRRRWGGEKQGERKERGRGWRKRRGMLIIEPNIMDPPHVQRKNGSVLDNTFISSSNKLVTYNQILFDWGLLHLGSGGYYLKIVSFMNSIIFLLYFYFFHDKVVGKKKHHFRMSNYLRESSSSASHGSSISILPARTAKSEVASGQHWTTLTSLWRARHFSRDSPQAPWQTIMTSWQVSECGSHRELGAGG